MKLFPMKCRKCGRDFLCDGHCANLNFSAMEKWWKIKDRDKPNNSEWIAPKFKKCTCDDCRNRLIDENGKPCNNHCEPTEIKVEFT